MAERGGGAIISTASIAGLVGLVSDRVTEFPPVDGSGAYIAAKHGVVGLTRQFALIYATHGVRVNAIAPGYIRTPMVSEALEYEGRCDTWNRSTPSDASASRGDRIRRRLPRQRRRLLRNRRRAPRRRRLHRPLVQAAPPPSQLARPTRPTYA